MPAACSSLVHPTRPYSTRLRQIHIFGYFAEDTSSIPKRQITFASAQSFNSGVARPGCVATEDFNGDGYRDFVVTDHIHSLAVFLGKGDGTFREPVLYTLDFYVVGCVAVGDFNGDGKMDVVVVGGDSSGNSLALLTGNGDGTFNPPTYLMTKLGGAGLSMGVGDLHYDGNLDIFIGGDAGSGVSLGHLEGVWWKGV